MLAGLGRTGEARHRLSAEPANGFDYPCDMAWLASIGSFADTAATVEDAESARTLLPLLEPYADHVTHPGATFTGAVARRLGLLGTPLRRDDDAERWFEVVHDIHGRLRTPFWTALGQLDHADLLLSRPTDGSARARQHACRGSCHRPPPWFRRAQPEGHRILAKL